MVSSMRASSERAKGGASGSGLVDYASLGKYVHGEAVEWRSEDRQSDKQAGRQAGKSRAGGGEERRGEGGRGEEESRLGGINDPWVCYLMSSSGDANSTAEQLDGLLGS